MQSTCRNKTVTWICKQIDLGNMSLTHKLQRKEGQWNRKMKSDLIDSLLREYPINPTYALREGSFYSIIDGVQRISTLRDYLAGKFSLSKNLDPIIFKTGSGDESTESEYIIAGKRFADLDEIMRETLKASELQIYELVGATEKDVREIFRRQNAGKALNKTQLRKVIETDEMGGIIRDLASQPLFEKLLTPAQRRKDLDKEYIRETLMLIETDQENDYTSFRDNQINAFIEMYQENIPYEKIEILKQAVAKLDESFESIRLNASSIPMVLYVAYQVIKENKSFDQLAEIIQDFANGYEANEEYKAFCGQGTTSSDKVKGRFEYWRRLYEKIS